MAVSSSIFSRFSSTSLSARLKLLTILWVIAAVFSIAYTLSLSWQLEGAGAAINDAGSLRMRTYRLVYLLEHHSDPNTIFAELDTFQHILKTIEQGDPERPLFLPDRPDIYVSLQALQSQWGQVILPLLHAQNIPDLNTL